MNHSRIIHFADSAIKINIASPEILEAVDVHFAHCIGEDKDVIGEYQVEVEEEAGFSIQKDGEIFMSDLTSEQVLFHLMQDGLTVLNGESKTNLVFHAAALAHQDRGLLLCGKSGSGKSTLTAWLVANGFQYLTDEVISYPIEGEEISGFCRSLVLKKGSAFIWQQRLKKSKTNKFLQFKDGSVWLPPALLNPSAVRKKVKPEIIIFPNYVRGADFQVERLTSANTLFGLLQILVNARNFPDHGMAVAARLAQQTAAYRLVYSDIEIATQWIQKTLITE